MTITVQSSAKILKQIWSKHAITVGFLQAQVESSLWVMWSMKEINYHDYSTLCGKVKMNRRTKQSDAVYGKWLESFRKEHGIRNRHIMEVWMRHLDPMMPRGVQWLAGGEG